MSSNALNCTLLIPTFNRSRSLTKLVRYLEKKSVEISVVVLDSSDDEHFEKNEALLSRHANFSHRRFDRDVFFYEKLYRGALKVTTDYIALCADDDIIVPESVHRFVELLEQRADCSYAHGYTIRFSERENSTMALGLEYHPIAYDEESALDRIQSLHSRVESTVWSVYRTPILLSGLDYARKSGSYFFGEMSTMLFPLVLGKGASLPIPLIFRSCEPFAEPISRWHPVYWILEDRVDFFSKYKIYRDQLCNFMLRQSRETLDQNRISEFLDICFMEFFAPQWPLAKGLVLHRLQHLKNPVPVIETTYKTYKPSRVSRWNLLDIWKCFSKGLGRLFKSTESGKAIQRGALQILVEKECAAIIPSGMLNQLVDEIVLYGKHEE